MESDKSIGHTDLPAEDAPPGYPVCGMLPVDGYTCLIDEAQQRMASLAEGASCFPVATGTNNESRSARETE